MILKTFETKINPSGVSQLSSPSFQLSKEVQIQRNKVNIPNCKAKVFEEIFNAFKKEWKINFSRLLQQKTFLSLLPPHRCFCTEKCTIHTKVCRAKEKAKFGAFNGVHCSFSSLYLHFVWTPEKQIVFHPSFLSRNKDFVASKMLNFNDSFSHFFTLKFHSAHTTVMAMISFLAFKTFRKC